jgi:hypothetical protein
MSTVVEGISLEKIENNLLEIVRFLFYIRESDWGYNKKQAENLIINLGVDLDDERFE